MSLSPAEEAIERLLTVFGEPKTVSPDRFLDEYRRALTGIEGRVLEQATDRVIRKSTFWPKPAEVIAEAHAIAAQLYEHKTVDWDALEAERRKGWSLADLAKSNRNPGVRARVQAMVDEMKRNIEAMKVEEGQDAAELDWKRTQRPGFEEMQRTSPNRGLHRSLSPISKRMTGERE